MKPASNQGHRAWDTQSASFTRKRDRNRPEIGQAKQPRREDPQPRCSDRPVLCWRKPASSSSSIGQPRNRIQLTRAPRGSHRFLQHVDVRARREGRPAAGQPDAACAGKPVLCARLRAPPRISTSFCRSPFPQCRASYLL